MLVQILSACGLIAATVVIQALSMAAGLRTLKAMESDDHPLLTRWPTLVVVLWVLFLLVPVAIDVTIWATFFRLSGILPDFEAALYFSIVTFTTVGYGDVVLDRGSRLMATCEAVNGWIIFGWATALLMIVIQRLYLPGTVGPSK